MRNPVDLHIGQRLRNRRWFQGMTQHQVAEAIGIRFQQVQKYESGANRISASRLWEIARSLDVPVSFFFDGLDDPNRSPQIDSSSQGTMYQRETIELVRVYYAIDEGPRRRLLALAKAITNQDPQDSESTVQTAQTLQETHMR